VNAQLELSKVAPQTVLNSQYSRRALPLFKIAFVLVRLDYAACCIINANHGVM